ncbi:MAG: alternative ribosome rescue aminoacyl-tRNA hydrolase ArfB [Cyanobium sp.]|jgi:ribosome-associated protein
MDPAIPPSPIPGPEPAFWLIPGLAIPAAELRWRFSRSSGPGGQNVNRTDSRVELLFPLASSSALPEPLRQRALRRLGDRLVDGQLVVVAQEHRSQWRNRQAALERLATLLREGIAPPPPPRRPTRPSRGSVERRLAAKKRRSAIKGQRRGQGPPAEE